MNKFENRDCLEGMQDIPDKSIDMILTSPPYDNLREYNNSSKWNFEIFKRIAFELKRVLKDGCVIVWIVGDATTNGSETGTSFKQVLYFNEIGFNIHDTMIFKKINPIPLNHNRYEQAFEYMFILSKGKPNTFNPILEKCSTFGKYNHRRNTGRVNECSTRNRDENTFVRKDKYKNNVWEYTIGKKTDNGNHPAVFPKKLAEDHIISWTNENDIVLDPFIGSGTTAIACLQTNRQYIGFEKDKTYYDIACKRIKTHTDQLRIV